jgi:uncharacterized RDD family membrane protein YckC
MESSSALFGKRLWAFVLDLFVLGLVMLIAQFTIPYVLPLFVWIAYKTVFECSAIQATPGKRAVGLIVTDLHGHRITLGASLIRTLVAFVSVCTLFFIYAVALFTARNQTLHDLLAGTVVVNGKPEADPFKAYGQEVTETFQNLKTAVTSTPPESASYLAEKEKLHLLEKLGRLKTEGTLTQEEFEERKKAILEK